MSDGSLKRCTADENADLFYGLPWAHGTLGFLVAIEIRIVRAKKYVRLESIPCATKKESVEIFDRESRRMDVDFVEGLMYPLPCPTHLSAHCVPIQSTRVRVDTRARLGVLQPLTPRVAVYGAFIPVVERGPPRRSGAKIVAIVYAQVISRGRLGGGGRAWSWNWKLHAQRRWEAWKTGAGLKWPTATFLSHSSDAEVANRHLLVAFQ